jgi:hypothetical protein
MKPLKLDEKALSWLALGASLLGLVALKGSISEFITIPAQAWSITLVCGTACSLIGILLGVTSKAVSVGEPTQVALERIVFRRGEIPRFITYARLGDLAKLQSRYESEFGKDVPSLELMKAWLERCDTCFTLVYEELRDQNLDVNMTLAGSFKMLPITLDAVDELEHGRVSGSTLKPEHICAEREAAAFYVGDLFAAGTARAAAVLSHLDSKCKELLDRGYAVYARPFTARGMRVMRNRGFVQLSTGKEQLEMRQLCRLGSDSCSKTNSSAKPKGSKGRRKFDKQTDEHFRMPLDHAK